MQLLEKIHLLEFKSLFFINKLGIKKIIKKVFINHFN